MFKWGASRELLTVAVYQALATVPGLKRGRTEARETAPVGPVADAVVDATLPALPAVVADMVRLQRLTGCRPGRSLPDSTDGPGPLRRRLGIPPGEPQDRAPRQEPGYLHRPQGTGRARALSAPPRRCLLFLAGGKRSQTP